MNPYILQKVPWQGNRNRRSLAGHPSLKHYQFSGHKHTEAGHSETLVTLLYLRVTRRDKA